MRKLNFLAAAMVSAMTLFTSCLGDGGNEITGSTSGIIFLNEKAGFKPMVDVGNAYLYFPQLANSGEYPEGTCVAVGYNINYDTPENANAAATGYLTASLMGEKSVSIIDQYRTTPITSEADTTLILENEIPLVSAFQASVLNNYVRGWLIFPSTAKVGSKQKREFKMMYPLELKAEEINGKRYYNLYLRAMAEGDDTGASNTSVLNAYYLKEVIDRANSIERAEGNKNYYLKFNFVSEIDKDNNKLTWDSEEAQMYVPEDNSSK